MAICLLSCAGYPRIQSWRTHLKCWWHPGCVAYLRHEVWAPEMDHLNPTCRAVEEQDKPLWSLASPSSSHSPARADPASLGKCTNSQEPSWCEGGERVRLQERKEENEEEEELIFLDISHRLTFVTLFYGGMIFLISSLTIPCEMYTKRMPKTLMDGGMDMDGCKDTSKTTTSPLLSCFSTSPTQIFMSHHLSLPSILTTDEKVFRTRGLYLVFQSNNLNVRVHTIGKEP